MRLDCANPNRFTDLKHLQHKVFVFHTGNDVTKMLDVVVVFSSVSGSDCAETAEATNLKFLPQFGSEVTSCFRLAN